MDKTKEREQLMSALTRRAIGYTTEDVVEEYSVDEGKVSLVKRKVSSKEYPPDLSAINVLLELMDNNQKLSDMSDDELAKERKRLLVELKKQEEMEGQIKMNLEVLNGNKGRGS